VVGQRGARVVDVEEEGRGRVEDGGWRVEDGGW
jgi:hypothetical protein